MKFINEMFKENGRWSQGRIYLLLSIISYYIILGILTLKGFNCGSTLDVSSFKTIIEALQWSIGVFAAYAFGGKGISLIKDLLNKNKSDNQSNDV